VSLRLQKRLSASILKCGKRRVWLDPNEINEISMANSRQSVRRLIKDGIVFRKPVAIHSRSRVRKRKEAKRKGRHRGIGRRQGTREARNPSKKAWIFRIRVLRRLLRRYRDSRKIDKHLHAELYRKAKGNMFKNKRNLIEHIHKIQIEKGRDAQLKGQLAARKLAAQERRSSRHSDKVEKVEVDSKKRKSGEEAVKSKKTEKPKAEKKENTSAKTTSEAPKAQKTEKPKSEKKEQPKADSKEPKVDKKAASTKEQPKADKKEQPKVDKKEQPKADKKEPKADKKDKKEQPKTESAKPAEKKEQPKAEKPRPKNLRPKNQKLKKRTS